MKYLGLTKETLDPRGIVDAYNSFVAAAVTVLSGILGEYWYLFVIFAVFSVLDYVSGLYKARRLKIETSEKGLAGVVKKLWYWVILGVAFMVSFGFAALGKNVLGVDLGFLTLIGWFTLACLAVNEARSICENLVQAGVHVPAVLVKGLAVTQKLIKDKERELVQDDGEQDDNKDAN